MEKRVLYKSIFIVCIIGLCAYFAFPFEKRINLGLDLQGGMQLLLKVDTSNLPEDAREGVTDLAIEKLRGRIDDLGVSEPSIQRHGVDEILVQLPGVTDRERALNKLGQTGLLEFKLVSSDMEKFRAALSGDVPQGYEIRYTKDDSEPLLLESEAVLTGDALSDAMINFSQADFGGQVVSLRFNSEGAKKFAQVTAANIGRRLAIVLDGKVQSAPNIKEAIPSGEAVISGRFTVDQAQDLAKILKHGKLPAAIIVEEERTIGPLLGKDSIAKGINATIVGITLVLVFMVVYYLLAGVIANIALVLNLLMILGCLGMLPYLFGASVATLTLPGIAGVILSLGMAVDANVLINERIREELSLGKTLRSAIANGYSRAFTAIIDSNITTLFAAVILISIGTGAIKGFGVTLTIGIIASMFTAIVVTRTIFELLLHFGVIKNSLPMLKLIKDTKFDFIKRRRIVYFISLAVIITGLFLYSKKGRDIYGIDFAGGQMQEYSFKEAPDVERVRTVLNEVGLGGAIIQQFKDNPKVVLIRTSEDKADELLLKLKDAFVGNEIDVLRIERVGPVAGKHLKDKAVWALTWALIIILIYVAFRFKHFNFAFAGVVALIHDVLVAFIFLIITGRPIDLLSITAFLTIAGYSINDTIVIYDRVRENMRINRKLSLYELINLSVNQTLSRTILTTGLTLLVVVSIFIYGGEVLNNFAFTLLVGFISGIYSTVYIASPLVLAFGRHKAKA
ncbi:MAG: protein translocase subunit SecD [Candidatus Omnitrophota bacterium]|jgi:SecD/SecF fusion protein|nr:protein translocase subunit SecD [Candidatus Omnitrophota bacterium]MDD4982142.1 protein translocase subunit SecD [Candidatus Omnitrophota bacterium]